MPRSCSSGRRSVSTPVSSRTRTVLPWSMWPAVPRVSGCTSTSLVAGGPGVAVAANVLSGPSQRTCRAGWARRRLPLVDPDSLAATFRLFGREVVARDSPLYAQVRELIAGSPALLALAGRSREGSPTLFLAAIHDELLRDPDHALARYYPTVGGEGPGPGLGAALEDFCAVRADRLEATLATRSTQTNETGRCSGLLPAFAAVADGRPLALIEVGASAGLNLRWDRYAYDYGSRRAGAADSPVTIPCELVGPGV